MAATRRKRTRAQPNLTADRVRAEALALIEAEGLDGFSTRKLGRALGVEAMAIYWYYPSKDALLDAVVELLVGRLDTAPPSDAKPPSSRRSAGDGYIDGLRQLAHGYRGLAHAYPNAFQLLATRRFATEATYRFLDGLFALAEEHGLDRRTTARYYRLVASYCNGIALDELAALREVETKHDAKESREALPRVAGVFEFLAPEHFEDVFSFGLEILLMSLKQASAKPGRKAGARDRGRPQPKKRAARSRP
jgi:AcrR family transcriptional regulator